MPLKILLADDSLTAQNMGKKILAEAGYEVIAVSNGAQALKKIASDQPDLVVLDVYMPGYSGVELCERMRSSRETARTPIVLSVGKMEAFKPEEGTRAGADGLIVKPFEATELLAVVKKLAEKISPAPRPKRAPQPASIVAPTPAEPVPAEPEFQIPHPAVEVPQEIASTPVIGMELIPEEPAAPIAAAPIEFEVERDPAPVEIDAGSRMASAAGLSGVFEMGPTAHPRSEIPAEPAPMEEFERFSAPPAVPATSQQAPEPSADASATTVEHDFQMEAPPAPDGEAGFAPHAGPVAETWSAPPPDPSPSEYAMEPFDHAQHEASTESANPQSPEVLPELTFREEAVTAFPAETPHLSSDPVLNNSAAEFAAAAPVWVAEEAEIEPHEFSIPLYQQMQRDAQVSTALESEPPASPAVSAEPSVPSWELPAPSSAGPDQPEAELPAFDEAAILSEFEPSQAAPFAEPASADSLPAYFSPDLSADLVPASEAQPAAPPAPAPAPEPEHYAASEFAPPVTVPTVTEAPVDPARIASIVEQALERLKPELIAAVTRELEKKNQ